ncbi:MAG: nitroreductase family protein [Dysgonomonas sp.]|nr:nitroreductase family protein [Dysgonomonas sp.]
MDLIKDLNWRYACKWMNGKKIEKKDIDIILESIRLAPTSMGMQLFKVFVVEDKEKINEIFEKAAIRQKMLPGCSHLLVFAAQTSLSKTDIDEFINRLGEVRNITGERLEEYRDKWSILLGLSESELIDWTIRQTYITMAYATVAAANLKIDATPVEGFEPSIVDDILNLKEQNLRSSLLLPLGYRDEETDRSCGATKVRKEAQDIFVF